MGLLFCTPKGLNEIFLSPTSTMIIMGHGGLLASLHHKTIALDQNPEDVILCVKMAVVIMLIS